MRVVCNVQREEVLHTMSKWNTPVSGGPAIVANIADRRCVIGSWYSVLQYVLYIVGVYGGLDGHGVAIKSRSRREVKLVNAACLRCRT